MTSTCTNMSQTLVHQNTCCNHPRYVLNQSSTDTIKADKRVLKFDKSSKQKFKVTLNIKSYNYLSSKSPGYLANELWDPSLFIIDLEHVGILVKF